MHCPRCNATLRPEATFCPACGEAIPQASKAQARTALLSGRYRIVRMLATGGMGTVYLAEDERLGGAPVAIKEMVLQNRPAEPEAYEEAVELFRREATILARLSHPHLPRVIDQFEEHGKQFLVMEYIAGVTLRQQLEREGLPSLEQVLDWAGQLCGVLGYLHTQETPIIYRDLKPSNVMIRPDGRLALIDFGIARFYKPGKSSDTVQFGTLGYAAPEQYGQDQTDARSDIYALGVLLHQLLSGYDPLSTPFRRPALAQLRPDLPAGLSAVLERASATNPEDRFDSAAELYEALQAAAHERPLPWVQAALAQAAGQHAAYIAPPQAQPRAVTPAPNARPAWQLPALLGALLLAGLVLWLVLSGPGATSEGERAATPGAATPTPGMVVLKPQDVHALDTEREGIDSCNNKQTYEAAKAVDGQRDTAWRVPYDGEDGVEDWIELSFDQPVRISSIGIIPGHDKADPCSGEDRFAQNRVIRRIRLEFEGHPPQEALLQRSRELQRVEVPGVVTQRVRVVILASDVGTDSWRKVEAISEIEVLGTPTQ